jgi:hypothetical protein
VPHIGVLLEPKLAVIYVQKHTAKGATQRSRKREVIGLSALCDVEPVVTSERGRVEPAARTADVEADELVRAVLRDTSDLTAFEAAGLL